MDERSKRILYYAVGWIALLALFKGRKQVADAVTALTRDPKKDFLAKIGPATLTLQSETGIAPIIPQMQAALESRWGKSGLTQNYNNLFGYTADAWLNTFLAQKNLASTTPMSQIKQMDLSTAPFAILPTHEESTNPPAKIQYFSRPGDIISAKDNGKGGSSLMVWRPFKKYNTWLDSSRDWAALLKAPRYAAALAAAKAGDSKTYAQAVAQAGYATKSDYALQLVSVATQIGAFANA